MAETDDKKSIDEKKLAYIRAAVDNMRHTVHEFGKGEGEQVPGVRGSLSYELACYTKAISDLYDRVRRGDLPRTPGEMKDLILNTASTINGGQKLERDNRGMEPEAVDAAVDHMTKELFDLLERNPAGGKAETLALIEYLMRYAKAFYPNSDRRTSEAVGAFFLMHQGEELPEYKDTLTWKRAAWALPAVLYEKDREGIAPGTPQTALAEMNKSIGQLRGEGVFRDWTEAFRKQFPQPAQHKDKLDLEELERKGPWKFRQKDVVEEDSTSYKPEYVSREKEDIQQIEHASGVWAQRAAVFRPERMALQETIAAVVTSIKMEKPTRFLNYFLHDPEQSFMQFILPRVRKLDESFAADMQILEEYVDYIMDDHFHIKNPQMEIRGVLGKAREAIEKRVESGSYSPRLTETRSILLHMVADDLIRNHYRHEVRKIVDQEIGSYLQDEKNRELHLPLKSNRGRVAWVTAGGPAAGKSGLNDMITREYKETLGDPRSLCQVDPDLFKPLLVPEGDADPRHVGPTHHESLLVRDLIVDRLQEMTARDRAPDFWLSSMAPQIERMALAAEGGAKVNLHMVSCPVEGESGAVERAWKRALDGRPDNTDFHRFMPVEATLGGHREASAQLPKALAAARRDLRLFDTQGYPATLMAAMDSYNRELRVTDPQAFLGFVKKSFLDDDALSGDAVYMTEETARARKEKHAAAAHAPSDEMIARALCEYLDAGVNLNFRYDENKIPNELRGRIGGMLEDLRRKSSPGNDEQEERTRTREGATLQMIYDSQPESYMWAGHGRTVIPDFAAFVRAMGGDSLAEAFLIELAGRRDLEVLSVRDFTGKQLLLLDRTPQRLAAEAADGKTPETPLDKAREIRYNILHDPGYDKDAPDAPKSMQDPLLPGIIERVGEKIMPEERETALPAGSHAEAIRQRRGKGDKATGQEV